MPGLRADPSGRWPRWRPERRHFGPTRQGGFNFWRLLKRAVLALVLFWLGLILLYRWVDPPITPLMLLRWPAAGKIERHTVPLGDIARTLQRAVIVSEDGRFCAHHGIDWQQVSDAIAQYRADGHLRGASTITMQTARNLFLWPGGGFLRKAVEAVLALAIDALWPKRRIMEVYLNIIEWGDGIYGADAAARAFFHTRARDLTPDQAAALTAVLPNPRHWSPNAPDSYVADRAATIAARVGQYQGYFDCLTPTPRPRS